MSVIKQAYPILEYDTSPKGIIKPEKHGRAQLPEICVMTYLKESLEYFVTKYHARIISSFNCGIRKYPIYFVKYKEVDLCLVQAITGSALTAMLTEYLISYGVKKFILSGGCGVLVDIALGETIIPVSALRDEGASYHYLPPSRDVAIDRDVVTIIRDTLLEKNVHFTEAKTWTTDGFFRETRNMINYRRNEGCSVVEMECATIAAVTQFRGCKFGAMLYAGDTLEDFDHYDEREWTADEISRKKLFELSLEVAVKL
jgi:uridine phosphorylase